MKKIIFLLLCTAFIACTKNPNQATKDILVVAENMQSIVPLVADTTWNEDEWKALYKYDNEKIFGTIVKGILAGKLKAFRDCNDLESELSIAEFTNIIVAWDSTAETEDPNKPGTFISAPIKYELTGEDVVQLRFNEELSIDTVSYMMHKKIASVSFVALKYSETGETIGIKNLFGVKFNDANSIKNKH